MGTNYQEIKVEVKECLRINDLHSKGIYAGSNIFASSYSCYFDQLSTQLTKIQVLSPDEIFLFLDSIIAKEASTETRVKGYRVKVEYGAIPKSVMEWNLLYYLSKEIVPLYSSFPTPIT